MPPSIARTLPWLLLSLLLAACSPRQMIIDGIADEMASQGQAMEDDLELAREASAFYLKLSESLLRASPDHPRLPAVVVAGFVQYAYAFVASEADRVESRDAVRARMLRQRAARLYVRARDHGLAALERRQPGLRAALATPTPPQLRTEDVDLAYWTAAAWGGAISLSKDDPEVVADLPAAFRLADLAWRLEPAHAEGGLASLMGSFEAGRPGGSRSQALAYFDAAQAAAAGRASGPYVARAEQIALPAGDRAQFDALLRQALDIAGRHRSLQNEAMRVRARWLLDQADDLF